MPPIPDVSSPVQPGASITHQQHTLGSPIGDEVGSFDSQAPHPVSFTCRQAYPTQNLLKVPLSHASDSAGSIDKENIEVSSASDEATISR